MPGATQPGAERGDLTQDLADPSEYVWHQRDVPFAPDVERLFQASYYANVRGLLRIVAALLVLLFLAFFARDYLDTQSLWQASRSNGISALLCVGLLVATLDARFRRIWQPSIVVSAWVAAGLGLSGMAAFFAAHPPPGSGPSMYATLVPMPPELLYYALQTCTLMLCFTAFRLQFGWQLMMQAGLVGIAAWFYWHDLVGSTPEGATLLLRFVQPTLLVLVVLCLMAFVQERLERRAFWANYELDQERSDERRRREQTEAGLRVLNRAIGGVVHDLGNPLASVQTGSETLRMLLDSDDAGAAHPEVLREMTEIICDGSQMLDYLRLSLIEQSRVLEGQPIPVERARVPLRQIVEAGLRYQKARYASGRETSIVGEDLEVYVDRMQVVAVFMNLVGNALKYSDGEVRIAWRVSAGFVNVGVMDEGCEGQGLTRAQADRLFVAFGRLNEHSGVEGVGLGLLSAQKIVEAHGGRVYVEGTEDGLAGSSRFCTVTDAHGSMLEPPFRTAFVVTLPLPPDGAPTGPMPATP